MGHCVSDPGERSSGFLSQCTCYSIRLLSRRKTVSHTRGYLSIRMLKCIVKKADSYRAAERKLDVSGLTVKASSAQPTVTRSLDGHRWATMH